MLAILFVSRFCHATPVLRLKYAMLFGLHGLELGFQIEIERYGCWVCMWLVGFRVRGWGLELCAEDSQKIHHMYLG